MSKSKVGRHWIQDPGMAASWRVSSKNAMVFSLIHWRSDMAARIPLALIFFAVLGSPNVSLAQETAAKTASTWGLLGIWRKDCSKPASESNTEQRYLIKDGKLFEDRELGKSLRDSTPITSATIKPDGSIELVYHPGSTTWQKVLIKGKDTNDRYRVTSNKRLTSNKVASNLDTVIDGKFTNAAFSGTVALGGKPTSWITRCR
jgi:hypothetical protein